MSADLIAFLRARLDEDAQVEHLDRISEGHRAELLSEFDAGESPEYPHMEVGFGRWLAEVHAKRFILDEYEDLQSEAESIIDRLMMPSVRIIYERIIRILALPYADHPAYREEWRP